MIEDLISIITPCYNAENYIQKTYDCILAQTYGNWEWIIVDDCSTDDSVKIINTFDDERVKLIVSSNNSGPAIARNIGIDKAKGEFVAFQDSDDLWEKVKLEHQINFMKLKQCAFSFTGYEFANIKGIPNGKKVFVPEYMKYQDALKNTTISTITVMFDLKKIEKNLIKMPNIESEDTATWWKILRNGYVAYGLNEVLSYYRRYQGSLSSNKLIGIKRIWNLYRHEEKINLFNSFYYLITYLKNAIKRRI